MNFHTILPSDCSNLFTTQVYESNRFFMYFINIYCLKYFYKVISHFACSSILIVVLNCLFWVISVFKHFVLNSIWGTVIYNIVSVGVSCVQCFNTWPPLECWLSFVIILVSSPFISILVLKSVKFSFLFYKMNLFYII